jgi:hypothetical protein
VTQLAAESSIRWDEAKLQSELRAREFGTGGRVAVFAALAVVQLAWLAALGFLLSSQLG